MQLMHYFNISFISKKSRKPKTFNTMGLNTKYRNTMERKINNRIERNMSNNDKTEHKEDGI